MTIRTTIQFKKDPQALELNVDLSNIFRDTIYEIARREGISEKEIHETGIEQPRIQYVKTRGFGFSGTIYFDTRGRRHTKYSQAKTFLWWPVDLEREFEKQYRAEHYEAPITKVTGEALISGLKLTIKVIVNVGPKTKTETLDTGDLKEIKRFVDSIQTKFRYDTVQYFTEGQGVLQSGEGFGLMALTKAKTVEEILETKEFPTFGLATTDIPDNEETIIDRQGMEEALKMLLSYGKSFLEHQDVPVGDLTDSFRYKGKLYQSKVDNLEKILAEYPELKEQLPEKYQNLNLSKYNGMTICTNIRNDSKKARETRLRIAAGELNGHSIRGDVLEGEKQCNDEKCFKVVKKFDLYSIVYCQFPKNDSCRFALINSAELKKALENITESLEDILLQIVKGDFEDCVAKMRGKEGVTDPEALCAWLCKRKTGDWPAEKAQCTCDKLMNATEEKIPFVILKDLLGAFLHSVQTDALQKGEKVKIKKEVIKMADIKKQEEPPPEEPPAEEKVEITLEQILEMLKKLEARILALEPTEEPPNPVEESDKGEAVTVKAIEEAIQKTLDAKFKTLKGELAGISAEIKKGAPFPSDEELENMSPGEMAEAARKMAGG
jgi:hypothetical protein